MYRRIANIKELARKKSIFLFGPRSTGKTTLLRHEYGKEAIVNLLKSSVLLPLIENPSRIAEIAREKVRKNGIVIIDEIQKLPILLNEVHNLIETENMRFILTGSSARKLKRSGVNLLAGRAWEAHLFPLSYKEIPDFNLERYLLFGGLPQVYGSEWPEEELDAYVNTYLREEIKEEALVQNFIHFSRFLKVAAISNAEQLNYANVSRDTGIPATSVRAYFDILSDTFVGFLLPGWRESKKRKAAATAKFYFFDIGVANFLNEIKVLHRNSSEFGKAFEHFIAMELRSYLSYRRIKKGLSYWRTHNGTEVDFLIGRTSAVEVKATAKIQEKHLKGLRMLREEGIVRKFHVVCLDETDRQTSDGIRVLHWRSFLDQLWNDELEI
jgi:predicted AAA+ superfamily ATPase